LEGEGHSQSDFTFYFWLRAENIWEKEDQMVSSVQVFTGKDGRLSVLSLRSTEERQPWCDTDI